MARRGENIYKRKDGRYEGRYVIGKTESGRTRFGYVYGRQYTQVRSELMRRKADRESNRGPKAKHTVTMQAWMDAWLAGEMRSRLKASSLQTYQRLYRLHIRPQIGHIDITTLTAADLYGMLAALESRNLSRTTQKSVLRLCKAALRCAAEEGLILRNPCDRVRLRVQEQEQRVLSAVEQKKMKAALLSASDVPALLGLYTGMRLGEICALQWADIDFGAKTLFVRHTVQRIESSAHGADAPKTTLSVTAPKSSSSRRVLPVPDFILDLLRTLCAASDSPYVFGTADRAADPRTIQRRFRKTAERLSLSGVHFHTARHTFATRMLEIGVDVKTVSTMLGHSSAKTTLDFYAHSMLEQQRRAMETMTERL